MSTAGEKLAQEYARQDAKRAWNDPKFAAQEAGLAQHKLETGGYPPHEMASARAILAAHAKHTQST